MKSPSEAVPQLPTGTVTFLFTDIVGSTPLWESQPEQMAKALQIHNTALRRAIEANGGIIFKFVGDEYQAAFSTAPQALKAAVDGQLALQAAEWNELGELKVRMGLHTGEAELDPDGDEYAVSHIKNRAGRIRSAAYGGQILLSQETSDLVRRKLPVGVTLRDMGEHRLKGMEWLERLFQVCAPGLTQDFPPLATGITHPNNLPIRLTSFIGREREIDTVCSLLSEYHLVTLIGSGGTGKTRLSLQVAGLVLENYPHGAWLVELAPLADPYLVPQAVASAMNIPEMPGKTLSESVEDYLRSKCLLLILDNCEHLLEACTRMADRLLRACPELTILASSREFLGVKGESPFRVPPLSLPDARRLPVLDEFAEYDAVRLFVERARMTAPGFTLNEKNAAAISQVVNRLDGIPLAIELAAARLRLLSVEQIAQRLNDAFRLLTGGSRAALPRHQTLRALIDWSYDLLTEPERIVFRRLSVFFGRWTLEAAEQVCADEPAARRAILPEEILELLSGLGDKSLIMPIIGEDGTNHYNMLETIRQYAHEKLVDEKEAEAVRTRHLVYYLELAEELEPKIRSREQLQTLDRLELEVDNLRLALEWALQTEVESELKLAASLQWFWHISSRWSEGIDWIERGLQVDVENRTSTSGAGCSTILRAIALGALGFHYLAQYQFESVRNVSLEQITRILDESLSIFRSSSTENRRRMAWALLWRGSCYSLVGETPRSMALTQEALSLFRENSDAHGMAESLQIIGSLEADPARCKKIHLESLAIEQANGDAEGIANAFGSIGGDNIDNGEFGNAYSAFEASLAHYQQVKNRIMTGLGFRLLGFTSLLQGDLMHARQWLDQSMAISSDLGDDNSIVFSLYCKGLLVMAEGGYDQLAEMNEDAWRIAQKSGIRFQMAYVLHLRARLARVLGDRAIAQQLAQESFGFGSDRVHHRMLALTELGYLALESGDLRRAGALLREGLQGFWQWREKFWVSFPLDALALLAAREGNVERAARLFGSRWCRGYFHFLSPSERQQRQNDLASIRAAIGDECFEQLYEQGRTLNLLQAVALALEGNG